MVYGQGIGDFEGYNKRMRDGGLTAGKASHKITYSKAPVGCQIVSPLISLQQAGESAKWDQNPMAERCK